MHSRLAPGLLAAAPTLTCPFFSRSLVLLADYGDGGAFGFVVNRPTDMRLMQVLHQSGLKSASVVTHEDTRVLVGGPVAPESGWLAFDPRGWSIPAEGSMTLCEDLVVSASLELLQQIGAGEGPERRAFFLGYAGWGPGQLDEEIRSGSWIPLDIDSSLVFDLAIEERWAAALHKLGIDPGRVAKEVGHA